MHRYQSSENNSVEIHFQKKKTNNKHSSYRASLKLSDKQREAGGADTVRQSMLRRFYETCTAEFLPWLITAIKMSTPEIQI